MAKKAKKMSEATKKKLAAYKKAKKGGGKKAKAKGGAKKAKGLAMSPDLRMQVVAKNAPDGVRLGALEHNVGVLARGLNLVADKVAEHDRALMGAGLLKRRGKR